MVVVILGVFALVALVGTLWLVDRKAEAGSIAIIAGLCGTALGSVGAILANTSRQDPHMPQDVNVTNKPDDPVPVKTEPEEN